MRKTQIRKSSRPIDTPIDGVARRAYELFEARGAQHGHDVDDWLRAEHDLRADAHNGRQDASNRPSPQEEANEPQNARLDTNSQP